MSSSGRLENVERRVRIDSLNSRQPLLGEEEEEEDDIPSFCVRCRNLSGSMDPWRPECNGHHHHHHETPTPQLVINAEEPDVPLLANVVSDSRYKKERMLLACQSCRKINLVQINSLHTNFMPYFFSFFLCRMFNTYLAMCFRRDSVIHIIQVLQRISTIATLPPREMVLQMHGNRY